MPKAIFYLLKGNYSVNREQELLLFNLPDGYKYIDTSQSLSRVTTSCEASKLFTILPGAQIWATDLKRYLVGTEHLHLQGIPSDRFTLSERQKSDLAGNSFTSTCILAVLSAVVAQADVGLPQDNSVSLRRPYLVSRLSRLFGSRRKDQLCHGGDGAYDISTATKLFDIAMVVRAPASLACSCVGLVLLIRELKLKFQVLPYEPRFRA